MKMNWFEYFLMTFDSGRNFYLRGIVQQLHGISQLPPNQTILEIGCGNGTGTKFISEFFQPMQLIATELDERLVKIATLKNNDSSVNVEVGNATNLRFDNNTFDAVIGLSVIHHIPNWRDCVDELHRILKQNGLLILKELSIETFESSFGRIARRFVEHPYDSMLKKNEFIAYIEEKGFAILDCRPHSMMGLLTDFLLVARRNGLETRD